MNNTVSQRNYALGSKRSEIRELLEYGKIQAQKKMCAIEAGLKRIELLQKEIEHSNLLLESNTPITYDVPKREYFVLPMEAPMTDSGYNTLDRLHIIAVEKGYSIGQELGLLYIFEQNNVQRYQFIEVVSPTKKRDPNIISIPAGRFIARTVASDSIENAEQLFPEQFADGHTRFVIETELFTGNADIENPMYELRCSQ